MSLYIAFLVIGFVAQGLSVVAILIVFFVFIRLWEIGKRMFSRMLSIVRPIAESQGRMMPGENYMRLVLLTVFLFLSGLELAGLFG